MSKKPPLIDVDQTGVKKLQSKLRDAKDGLAVHLEHLQDILNEVEELIEDTKDAEGNLSDAIDALGRLIGRGE